MMDMPPPDMHYTDLLNQIKSPAAIVREDTRDFLDSLMPGLLYKNNEIIQASLNGLMASAIRASTTKCYKPTHEPVCFKFIVGKDGSLNGAIAYDSDGRPIMLNYAVLLRKNKPAVIIYYKSYGGAENPEEEWLIAGNVAYVSGDDGALSAKVQDAFSRHKNKKNKH